MDKNTAPVEITLETVGLYQDILTTLQNDKTLEYIKDAVEFYPVRVRIRGQQFSFECEGQIHTLVEAIENP